MTTKQIVLEKLKRMLSVPGAFVSGLASVEKAFSKAVIALVSQLTQDASGNIIINNANLTLLAEIETALKNSFLGTGYAKLVDAFIQQFDKQAQLSDLYFKKEFEVSKVAPNAVDILQIKKEAAVNLLFSDNVIEQEFISPLKQIVEQAITSQASFKDTLSSIQDIVTGNEEIDSKIMRYSKQVAYDTFAVSDRAYMQTVSDDLEAEWFQWAGDVIPTSRTICIENHNHYFHKKEIEEMASKDWSGKMDGTNKQTIFQTAGGFNCQHSILPVSVFKVPKETVERNVSNGNFEPSTFEVEAIGL